MLFLKKKEKQNNALLMSGSDFQKNSISQRRFGTEGKISALDPQGQVLSPEVMYLLQSDREQRIRDKDRRGQERRGREQGKRGRGICPGGQRIASGREETDVAHRRYKGKPCVRMRDIISIRHIN